MSMDFEGDKYRTIVAMLTVQAWRDPAFRARLVRQPKEVLAEQGVKVPDGLTISVVEDTSRVKYVNLTRELDVQDKTTGIAALMERLLPIPAGHEVRFVQSTDQVRYIVLPVAPPNLNALKSGGLELMMAARDSGVEATFHDTTQSVEAETTEVVVSQTTEAQDAETTTTVVAEAELVAT